MLAYFPSFGRCFSNSFNSRMTVPVVTVLVVVSWVPMPMVTVVCALATPGQSSSAAMIAGPV